MKRATDRTQHDLSLWQPILLPFLSCIVVSIAQNSFLVATSAQSISLWRIAPYSAIESLLAIVVFLGTCAYFSRVRELTKENRSIPTREKVWLPIVFGFFATNPSLACETWTGYLAGFSITAVFGAHANAKHDVVRIVGDRWHGILERRFLQLSDSPKKRSDLLPLDVVYFVFVGILAMNRFHTNVFPQY